MMNLIKFNKEYYQPIIDGIKTQTLRTSNKRIKKDEIVKAIFPGTPHECKLQITRTGYKQFKHLDEEDAKLEGYNSLNELKKDLLHIYPRLDNFDRLYYYRFKVVDFKLEDKILNYVSICVDNYHCSDKDEVKRIIREVIKDNPNETNWVQLGATGCNCEKKMYRRVIKMVYLDSEKLIECIEWENITKDTVTLKVDGEKLRQQIYDDLKHDVQTDTIDEVPAVFFQDAPLIKFYPNDLYDVEFCEKLALELKNRLNTEIKTKLGIE